MPTYARQIRLIESEVPYSPLIFEWLQLHNLGLHKFVEHSRKYERYYLAWETVRKVRNPFFVDGTGLEGYYVGQCFSPEEVAEKLLQIGHFMLTSNYRLYQFNHQFRSKLMKTLLAELCDPQAIEVWSAQFGAALGKLRCNLLTNAQTRYFQAETYQSTASLPTIRYSQGHYSIGQQYAVPCRGSETVPRWNMNLESSIKPSDTDAFMVVKSIGKFGHPLIREYLNERNLPLFTGKLA